MVISLTFVQLHQPRLPVSFSGNNKPRAEGCGCQMDFPVPLGRAPGSHPGLPKTGGQLLSGDFCVLCPSSNWRLPQKWKACYEKITRASGKFSSTAYFSDGKCHLVQAKTIYWNVLILAKLDLGKKKKALLISLKWFFLVDSNFF